MFATSSMYLKAILRTCRDHLTGSVPESGVGMLTFVSGAIPSMADEHEAAGQAVDVQQLNHDMDEWASAMFASTSFSTGPMATGCDLKLDMFCEEAVVS